MLMMAIVGLLPADDPRMRSTIETIADALIVGVVFMPMMPKMHPRMSFRPSAPAPRTTVARPPWTTAARS